mgnify:CR=1 FL=1
MENKDVVKDVISKIDESLVEQIRELRKAFLENSQDSEIKNSLSSFHNKVYRDAFVSLSQQKDEALTQFLRYSYINGFLTGDNFQRYLEFDDEVKTTLTGEDYPIVYVDEWLDMVNSGEIASSATEDLSKLKKKTSPSQMIKDLIQKQKTEKKNLEKIVLLRQKYISNIHSQWKNVLKTIITSDDLKGIEFTDKLQNDGEINRILEYLPKLSALSARITGIINEIKASQASIENLKGNVSEEEMQAIQNSENELLAEEFKSVKQMFKMCVGRQGNDFPLLCDALFPFRVLDRARAIELIEKIRAIDPEIFKRKFLGIDSDNPPYTLLAPVYGKLGVCWEAIPKINRETGRGKLILPLYPATDDETIMIRALGDFRWNKMKEITGFRWMSEGFTGMYYQYHEGLKADKRKGKKVKFNTDLKESFLDNYVLWIKFESQGVQKLDKELRKFFWMHIPFSEEIKELVKDRGQQFRHLYDNDKRKAMSDGY